MKTFWSGKNPLSETYEKLREELVPSVGGADTIFGEVLRNLGNLYYDLYNNGNCNTVECEIEHVTCYSCSGSGEVYNFDYDSDDEENSDEFITCDDCCGSGGIDEDGDRTLTELGKERFSNSMHYKIPQLIPYVSEMSRMAIKHVYSEEISEECAKAYEDTLSFAVRYISENLEKNEKYNIQR